MLCLPIPAGAGLEHYRKIQLLTEVPEPEPEPEEAPLTPEEAAALEYLRKDRAPRPRASACRHHRTQPKSTNNSRPSRNSGRRFVLKVSFHSWSPTQPP